MTQALKLFYRDGFTATGVDRISAQAGVSKRTLYNHFKSKDELVLATLRKRDGLFRNRIMRETGRFGNRLNMFDLNQYNYLKMLKTTDMGRVIVSLILYSGSCVTVSAMHCAN